MEITIENMLSKYANLSCDFVHHLGTKSKELIELEDDIVDVIADIAFYLDEKSNGLQVIEKKIQDQTNKLNSFCQEIMNLLVALSEIEKKLLHCVEYKEDVIGRILLTDDGLIFKRLAKIEYTKLDELKLLISNALQLSDDVDRVIEQRSLEIKPSRRLEFYSLRRGTKVLVNELNTINKRFTQKIKRLSDSKNNRSRQFSMAKKEINNIIYRSIKSLNRQQQVFAASIQVMT